jgi:hypothetical protein
VSEPVQRPDPTDSEADTRLDHLHPRSARRDLALARDYVAHLELAKRATEKLDGDTRILDEELVMATNAVLKLSGRTGETIQPRRRVPVAKRTADSAPRAEYLLFLDECGSHPLYQPDDKFPVFCLCGVIVNRDEYAAFDRHWKTWKAAWLGSSRVQVHEPEVRRRSNHFHNPDSVREQELLDALAEELSTLQFTCIAGVIDKKSFLAAHPDGLVDEFLPASGYLMCIDFVIERFVHFLYHAGGDARGLVFAENRGLREDAEVHAEFIRLQLEGTQWQSEDWFRYQLRPFIEFEPKDRNSSGLQVADLAARPVAEKVLNPSTTPERWQVIRPKLYDGGQGRPMSYGLKIYPNLEQDITGLGPELKANEGTFAPPLTD